MDTIVIEPNMLVICGLLCVGGVVLLVVLQVLGGVLGFLFGFVEMFLGILSGGPASWCGCLAVLIGIVVCGGLAFMLAGALSSCGTPDAVNLCRIF
jgi:uncharacterized protein involved in cysteine biosynthesis